MPSLYSVSDEPTDAAYLGLDAGYKPRNRDVCVVELGFNDWKKPQSRTHYAVPDDREGEIRELTFHDVEKYGVEAWL